MQRHGAQIPSLVIEAMWFAEDTGFERSCSVETGRLLRTLAAQVRDGVIGEIGTGCGVGAAWIAAGLRPGASFVTVELDPVRAAAARRRFAGVPRVHVIESDWREILAHAPFSLLFADAAAAKGEAETLFEALQPGGLLLLDDLTPPHQLSPEQLAADPLRRFWLGHSSVAGTEVQVRPQESVILAARL